MITFQINVKVRTENHDADCIGWEDIPVSYQLEVSGARIADYWIYSPFDMTLSKFLNGLWKHTEIMADAFPECGKPVGIRWNYMGNTQGHYFSR